MMKGEDEFILIKFYITLRKLIFILIRLNILLILTKSLTKDRFFFLFIHAPLFSRIAFGLLPCYSNTKLILSMTSLINLKELFLLAAYSECIELKGVGEMEKNGSELNDLMY